MRFIGSLFICIILAAFLFSSPSFASGGPSSRYCEAGFSHRGSKNELGSSPLNLQGVVFSDGVAREGTNRVFSDGAGFSGRCKIGFSEIGGLRPYLFASYDNASFDLTNDRLLGVHVFPSGGIELIGSIIFRDPIGTGLIEVPESSIKGKQARFGVGAEVPLTRALSVYGQAGVSRQWLSRQPSSFIESGLENDALLRPFLANRIDDGSFKPAAEAGVLWQLRPFLELGAFAVYDGAGALEHEAVIFVEQGRFEVGLELGPSVINIVFVTDEPGIVGGVTSVSKDIRGGASIALNIEGPFWLSGRYEAGKEDRGFVGLRVAF